MSDRLRQAISATPLIDHRAFPGWAGFFEDFPPEKRVLTAIDTYRSPAEAGYAFPGTRTFCYDALEAIYGFTRADIDDPAQKERLAREYARRKTDFRALLESALDASGIELMMANSFHCPDIKNHPRIRLIGSADPFIFPFDNTYLSMDSPLASSYLAAFEHMLHIHLVKRRVKLLNYETYTAMTDDILDGWARTGVAGVEFLLSLVRTAKTEEVPESEGPALFEKARRGDWQSYRRFQNLMIRRIFRQCGALNLVVQWRCSLSESRIGHFDCLHLAEMISASGADQTCLVITEGNWPAEDHAQLLALGGGLLPNRVYFDFSGRMLTDSHPQTLGATLRRWLEKPALWDKILYGSGYRNGKIGMYVAARTAREALWIALSGMIRDGILDEETAISLAGRILRDNARKLYRL